MSEAIKAVGRAEAMINRLMDDHALTIDGLLKIHRASTDPQMNDAAFRAFARYDAIAVLRQLASRETIKS